MTSRESALLSYFFTISTDERVRRAMPRSLSGLHAALPNLLQAVYQCAREDLPAVGRHVLGNAAQMAAPVAQDAAARFVGGIFQAMGDAISGAGKRR